MKSKKYDHEKFFKLTRMTPDQFDELLRIFSFAKRQFSRISRPSISSSFHDFDTYLLKALCMLVELLEILRTLILFSFK